MFWMGDCEDRVLVDILDYVFLPQGRYSETFNLIYLLEVCHVNNEGIWRVPDRRHGGQYQFIVQLHQYKSLFTVSI